MKFIQYLFMPLLLISVYGGCSNHGGSGSECIMQNELITSQCLAEDLLNVCEQFFCGATFPEVAVDFYFPPRDIDNVDCVIIDCHSLDCGIAGLFRDLEIATNGMPTGIISFELEEQFVCF